MTAAAASAREEDGPGVTTLELFFDLVFVFTTTQLVALIAVYVAVLLFEKRARAGAVTGPG